VVEPSSRLAEQRVGLRYFGHSAFLWITSSGVRILIDPSETPANHAGSPLSGSSQFRQWSFRSPICPENARFGRLRGSPTRTSPARAVLAQRTGAKRPPPPYRAEEPRRLRRLRPRRQRSDTTPYCVVRRRAAFLDEALEATRRLCRPKSHVKSSLRRGMYRRSVTACRGNPGAILLNSDSLILKQLAACFASMTSLPLESASATRSTFSRIAACRSVSRLVSW
jgi:hypothetical protein